MQHEIKNTIIKMKNAIIKTEIATVKIKNATIKISTTKIINENAIVTNITEKIIETFQLRLQLEISHNA